MESVLLGSVGLDVSMPAVVGEVFGHCLVGVQVDLPQVQAAGMVFGQAEQPAPIPGSGPKAGQPRCQAAGSQTGQ